MEKEEVTEAEQEASDSQEDPVDQEAVEVEVDPEVDLDQKDQDLDLDLEQEVQESAQVLACPHHLDQKVLVQEDQEEEQELQEVPEVSVELVCSGWFCPHSTSLSCRTHADQNLI